MKKLLALLFFFITLGTTPALAAPATLNPTADSYVYSTSPTSNYGSSTAMRSGFWVEFNQKYISLLKFDLSSLPDDAVVTSAELKLYVKSGISSGTMTASRNTEDWSESSVNWSTRPSNDDPRASALVNSGASYVSWDVTELVQDWFTGEHTNYGFSIVATAQETDFSADFFSRENSNQHPELIVYYDRPLPTPTPTSTPTPTPTPEFTPTPAAEVPTDRPVAVEEETAPSDDEPLVISPATPSAATAAARMATPSAQPVPTLARILQLISLISGLLFVGVAGYVLFKEIKKRRLQKEQEAEQKNENQKVNQSPPPDTIPS